MNITELSVKRPTTIIILVVLFIGLGIMGYISMGADLFPSVNTPIISISATYPGAGSEEMEKDVIKPIEDAVSAISGIDTIRSTSGDGYGYTILQFNMSTDINAAVIDVQNALESVKLPDDASKPVMRKFDMNAQAILTVSVSGTGSYEELYKEGDKIKKDLERLPGVGNVSLEGTKKKELTVKIDRVAMEYYGVSINTLLGKLKAENINVPAGQLKQDTNNQTVRVLGEFQGIEEIKDIRVPLQGGGTVRLADIAQVALDYPETTKAVRLKGKESIGIYIQKQSDANVVVTTDLVKKELEAIQKTLPQGVKLVVANDATTFINASLSETKRNLVEGIITTAIVLFLFLRRWRSSLIVLVAIPTSLISTFFMMFVFKFTFNILSLMALALCVGILVDDSIVILENIHRHMQMGKDPISAAIEGRKEIGMAAIAITLCDVVVFAPLAFLSDIVGQFFRQFGLTVVCATLFSLLVSFTLTPMLASRMLKKEDENEKQHAAVHKKQGWFSGFFDRVLKNGYKSFLTWSLNHRWVVIVVVGAGVALSLLLIPLQFIQTEFLPRYDDSKMNISINLTPGVTFKQVDEKVKIVEEYLNTLPEVSDYFTSIGTGNSSGSAGINVKLVSKDQRKKSQGQLVREVRAWGKKLTGVDFSVTETAIIDRTSIDGNKPIILNITGPNPDVLRELGKKVEEIVKSVPGTVDVDNTNRAGEAEISVRIDRLAASEYGITTYDVASTLRTAIEGTKAGVYRKNGDEYDIVVKYMDGQVKTPYDIGTVKIANPAGQQISLNQVARINQSDSPKEILRMDRQNVVTISANIQGRVLGTVNEEISQKLKTLAVPYGCEIKFGGDQEHMTSSFDSLIKVLIVSIFLVFMILVILYESFLTPFIRMLSLPCGIIGAFWGLVITGKPLNLVSMIGLIMLDGLVSKNGTLLIDYTNTLMKRGMPLREALLEAGTTRLRPILMTSVTMIMGMLPLALSLGDGSEIKSGMAIILIGGLVTSTILSPILLPVVYTLLDDLKKLSGRRNKQSTGFDGGAVI